MSKWIIDPDHTVAHFTTPHMMVTDVHGQFNKITGIIYFDQEDLSNTGLDVEIDASKIWTGVEARDNHLRSADFLDVEIFPTISFKSTKVEVAGISRLKIQGEVTIHGIRKAILIHAEFFGPNYYQDEEGSYTSIGFTGTTHINREDFGMAWNNFFGNGNFMVGKHINITLNAEADLASE